MILRATLRGAFLFLAALPAAGCSDGGTPPRPAGANPRVVSFSPALTQILCDMGLADRLVGVTTFCPQPSGRTVPIVGDRMTVSTEAVLNVDPDVVLIQQNPQDFAALRSVKPGVRIEHFTIETLANIASAIQRAGELAGRDDLGRDCRSRFEAELDAVRVRVTELPRPRVAFLYGFDGPAVAGKGTFLDEMIELAGGTNAAAEKYDRWANISNEGVLALSPEVLVCLVEPGTESAAREHWRRLADVPAVASGRVHVVTDRNWTIPSTRSSALAAALADMLHPAGGEGRR